MKAVKVAFVEDGEKRRVSKAKEWRIRHQDDEEARFDLLQVGDEVMTYFSPDKQFYLAMLIELETK